MAPLFSWTQQKSSTTITIKLCILDLSCLLGSTSGQDGVPLAEGDPGLFSAGGSKKCLKAFAQRAASAIIVLHCPILDLLAEAFGIRGYSTTSLIQENKTLSSTGVRH